MNFNYLIQHSSLFPAVIGISYSQFEAILTKFIPALRQAERGKAWSKPRFRLPGGGRKATLQTDRQKLFFILFYYKVYPTFRLTQALFCFDKRNCQLWKEFLELVLSQTLDYQLRLPKTKAKYMQQVLEVCPQLKEVLIDATERRIQRPSKNTTQEFYYSGKKKYHSVKNHILLNPKTKRVLSISDTAEGKRHDKRLAADDPNLYCLPPSSIVMADTGYLGLDQTNPRMKLITPYKKSGSRELTDFQKQTNRQISSIRVRVEHPFAWMKHFNILGNTFRNKLNKAHQPFKNIACLYNFCLNYH